jgi:hypothetical protein
MENNPTDVLTDEDIRTLKDLFNEQHSPDDILSTLRASSKHYEPSQQQKQIEALQRLVHDVFGDETQLDVKKHPAAYHFDRVVDSFSDSEVKRFTNAAKMTFDTPSLNPPIDSNDINDYKINKMIKDTTNKGGKNKSKKVKNSKKARRSNKVKKGKK